MRMHVFTCFSVSLAVNLEPVVLDDASESITGLQPGSYAPCMNDAFNGQYHASWTHSASGAHTAVFHIDPPSDGCYVIEEWHPGHDSRCNRFQTYAARMDVAYCRGKMAYGYIDQSKDGGRWNVMGALPFYKGWPGNVTLSNAHADCREGDGCFWVADAFRITKISGIDVKCVAPTVMPNATRMEEPEVDVDKQTGSTINIDAPIIVLDDATVEANTGWQVESANAPLLNCKQQGWGQRFLFLDPINTVNSAQHIDFIFHPKADGCYLVEEFHPANVCGKKMSPEVQITINYCKGRTAEVVLDQSTGGNRWNTIGILPFYVGESSGVRVRHPQVGAGIATADAFRFTKVASTCAAARGRLQTFQSLSFQTFSITLDNDEATVTGTPQKSCDASALHESAHTSADKSASAVYTISPPSTGCYRVDEYHPKVDHGCVAMSDAALKIDYCIGQSANKVIDLGKGGGQWNTVGHWPFYAGEPGIVTSRRAAASGLWTADGFRFTKVSENCAQIPYTRLLTLRLTGMHLSQEPAFNEGHLTRNTDLRLAFHQAMVRASSLVEKAVKVLAVRNGSIIVEFELSGDGAELAAANVKSDLAGTSSRLERDLCFAATVGLDPRPPCKVEVLQQAAIPTLPSDQIKLEKSSDNIPVLLICSISAGVLAVCIGSVIACSCIRKRRRAGMDAAKQVEQVVVEKGDAETDSTCTPELVHSEVQTDVSGEFSEVNSVSSNREI